MKIGILTYHSSHNYGAFLQAYALCECINKSTKHYAEIINFSMKKAEKVNRDCIKFNKRHLTSLLYNMNRFYMFEKCTKSYHLLSGKRIHTDNIEEFSEIINKMNYDAIIVGSDEVWKVDGYRGFPNPYWLPNIKCKKIAYATSSRTDISLISEDIKKYIKKFLENYEYIGVRDNVTYELITSCLDNSDKCFVNCDPTFLYEFNIDKIDARKYVTNKYCLKDNKKTIGLMIGIPEIGYKIIDKYKDRYNFISLYNYYGTKGFKMLDPFEWIKVISGVDILLTTFFHGMVFAIKTDTPFLAIENRELKDLEYSKSFDLLKRNNINQYFVKYNGDFLMIQDDVANFLKNIEENQYNVDFKKVREQEKKLAATFFEHLSKI